jgi:hypothetical protein
MCLVSLFPEARPGRFVESYQIYHDSIAWVTAYSLSLPPTVSWAQTILRYATTPATSRDQALRAKWWFPLSVSQNVNHYKSRYLPSGKYVDNVSRDFSATKISDYGLGGQGSNPEHGRNRSFH